MSEHPETYPQKALERLKQAVGELLEAEEDGQGITIQLGLYKLSVQQAFEECNQEKEL